MGAEITEGGQEDFEKCCEFFNQMTLQANDEEKGLGDEEAAEIDDFIGRYENSAQITQILWQLYYL
jgi:hypothetical protein